MGSGLLLVINDIIVFVHLPRAEVHGVLGNIAGKVCRPTKKMLLHCCYEHDANNDLFSYVNTMLLNSVSFTAVILNHGPVAQEWAAMVIYWAVQFWTRGSARTAMQRPTTWWQ